MVQNKALWPSKFSNHLVIIIWRDESLMCDYVVNRHVQKLLQLLEIRFCNVLVTYDAANFFDGFSSILTMSITARLVQSGHGKGSNTHNAPTSHQGGLRAHYQSWRHQPGTVPAKKSFHHNIFMLATIGKCICYSSDEIASWWLTN